MYIGITEFVSAYDKILHRCSSHSSCQLVIFVSCLNIDALCASKMLSSLFKKQLVQSQLVPVFGYSELKDHYQRLDENINSVIFVGCGGMVDLESFLEIDPQENTQGPLDETQLDKTDIVQKFKKEIFVLDCHRPWNLDNLFGSQCITCFDDGTVEESLIEQKKAYYKLIEIENELGDELDGDSDSEEEEDDRETQNENNNDDDDDDDVVLGKRSSEELNPKKSRKQRKREFHHLEKVLQEYYSQGSTVLNSLSVQIYSLLSGIGETNLDYLWLCILGVSSLDNSFPLVYNRLLPLLKDEVKRLTPSEKTKTPDSLNLEIRPDYSLFLLRHTSLYDSFYYSNYINAKLSLWNENGKKRLHKMFARMGIPLSVTQENWIYMDNNFKRDLGVLFDKNLDRYGLQDIVRDGFLRTFGYRGSISASEFVESITALLEVGNASNALENLTTANVSQKDDMNPGDEENREYEEAEEQKIDRILKTRQKKWIANFWSSWDVLDNNMEILSQGIKHATFLQRSVFETGVAILEKRLVKHLRIYRLCVLQDGPDLHLYRNPLTLLRLGSWLIEYYAENDEKQLLPLVLATLDETSDTYLCAGIAPRYPRGLDILQQQQQKTLNNFTVAFQQIAAETGAKVRIDNFETSIIEIRKDDLQPFLERLTLSGLI
ncbi:Cdc45 [Kluyveromyces lactis]|nr:Cdc45 [Kluyveromyces lactis]